MTSLQNYQALIRSQTSILMQTIALSLLATDWRYTSRMRADLEINPKKIYDARL